MRFRIRKSFVRRGLRFRFDKDDIRTLFIGALAILLLARLFYDSFLALPPLLLLLLPYLKHERARMARERRRRTGIQFRDAILCVAASQRAGYSVENAFAAAAQDMAQLHGADSVICRELSVIKKGLMCAVTLEDLLSDFARRSDHPDIEEFAEVFRVAKRNGGNMTGVIADTAKIIGDKAETERQIGVLIAAKRLEARLMEATPLFIIAYVGMTNRGFFAPLYHSLVGAAVMSVALFVYLAAVCMTERIIEIEV